tara:strand:+ start:675 stop:935 length:261 start_codon:yes stop_codon:yes gene_type:complete
MYYIHTKDNWVFDSAYTWRQAVTKRNQWLTTFKQFCNCQLRDKETGQYLPKAEVPELRISDGYPERDSQPLINEKFLMDVSGYKGN